MFSERVGLGGEILSLASTGFGGDSVRIAVGMNDGVVQVWSYRTEEIEPLFAVRMHTTVPKALNFINGGRELLVFGLWDGLVYVSSPLHIIPTCTHADYIHAVIH